MRHTNSQKLFNYWNHLRGDRLAPDRREIEPSDIRDILGETFILEIDREYGNVSFRLAGTRLCNLYGKELKGEGFLSLWREEDNMEVYLLAKKVFTQNKPCILSFDGITGDERRMENEMLLLPLLNGESSARRVLGAVFPLQKPSWSGILPFSVNELKYAREINPVVATERPPLAQARLEREVQHRTLGKKVAHLTVIDGGVNA